MICFIDKILKEVEDDSDDFFQSKHINKRREDYEKEKRIKEKELEEKNKEHLHKLENGLKKIKISYDNRDWIDHREELFLKLFYDLHVSTKIPQYGPTDGYLLSDKNGDNKCFYRLSSVHFMRNVDEAFAVDYWSILMTFELRFNMSEHEVIMFIKRMISKHFNLNDIEISWIEFSNKTSTKYLHKVYEQK